MSRKKLRSIESRPQASLGAAAILGIASLALSAIGTGASFAQQQAAQRKAQQEQDKANANAFNQSYSQVVNQQLQNDLNINSDQQMQENLIYAKGGRIKTSGRIKATDGGKIKSIGKGFLGVFGDTHNQTHKKGNQFATGVGTRLPDGRVIETEGGGDNKLGELIKTKNGEVRVYSKHPIINGYSPRDLILSGMDEDEVFALQQMYNGNNTTPPLRRSKARIGTRYNPYLPYTPNDDELIEQIKQEQGYYDVNKPNKTGNILSDTEPLNLLNANSNSNDNLLLGLNLGNAAIRGIGGYLGNYFAKSPSAPVQPLDLTHTKLKTRYNINPQIRSIDRLTRNTNRDVLRNSASSAVGLSKVTTNNTNAAEEINKLFADKYNKEAEMFNKEQELNANIDVENAKLRDSYNNRLYQYSKDLNDFENTRTQNMINSLVNMAGDAVSSYDAYNTRREKRYAAYQDRLAQIISSQYGTPLRMLQIGVDLDDRTVQSIYDMTTDEKEKKAIYDLAIKRGYKIK